MHCLGCSTLHRLHGSGHLLASAAGAPCTLFVQHTCPLLQHLALTINEELSLQEGLLERFEEEVDVTHSKLRVAQKRIKNLLRNPGDCKCTLLAALLMCVLIVIVLVAFKIIL